MRKVLFLGGEEMSLYPDNRAVVNHCMPSTIYALEGRELNIYWDSFLRMSVDVLNLPPEYRFDVVCTKGEQKDNRWTYTPTSADAGTTTWTLNIYLEEVLIKTITTSLVTKGIGVGSGVTKKLLMIGDSTTAGGNVIAELMNLFGYNKTSPATGGGADVMTVTPIGTLTTAVTDYSGTSRSTKHEGRSGWKLWHYATRNGLATSTGTSIVSYKFDNYTISDTDSTGTIYLSLTNSGTTRTLDVYKDSGRTTKVASGSRTGNGVITLTPEAGYAITGEVDVVYTSPLTTAYIKLNFFFRNGVLDISKYMTDNSLSMASGDWVMIHLGINDISAALTDAAVNTIISEYVTNLDTLIAAIHAYESGLKIGVLLTIPPCASQDAFGDDYDSGITQRRYARNRFLLNEAVLQSINSKAVTNVYALPYHLNLDTVNNFPKEISTPNARNDDSIMVDNNAVHPDRSGYFQLSDILKCNIKGFES